jgi:hypothetical protein
MSTKLVQLHHMCLVSVVIFFLWAMKSCIAGQIVHQYMILRSSTRKILLINYLVSTRIQLVSVRGLVYSSSRSGKTQNHTNQRHDLFIKC